MDLSFGNDATTLSSDCIPAGVEPGPAYSAPGIWARSNITRDPTCRTSGRSLPADLSSGLRASIWISADCGTDAALAVLSVADCAGERGVVRNKAKIAAKAISRTTFFPCIE